MYDMVVSTICCNIQLYFTAELTTAEVATEATSSQGNTTASSRATGQGYKLLYLLLLCSYGRVVECFSSANAFIARPMRLGEEFTFSQ